MEEDDFREWGAARHLTPANISILIENGVNSHAAVAALTVEDLPALGLKLGQMVLLRRLVSTDGSVTTSTAAPTAFSSTLSNVQTLQVGAASLQHRLNNVEGVINRYGCGFAG